MDGNKGDVLVGAVSINVVISSGTEAAVTFSIIVKAGKSRIVVGSA
jgi:hypothetical protein